MKKWLICLPLFLAACTARERIGTVDDRLTEETYETYLRIREFGQRNHTLFGQQDATVYGIGWSGDENQSDVESVCGRRVGLYGWDIGGVEYGDSLNIDGVPFDRIRREIVAAYGRGGINTVSWHMRNPLNGESSWSPGDRVVGMMLPGGALHDGYRQWLDRAAAFIGSLRTADGTPVPVLFRPFHENNGEWFWWGAPYASAEEYKSLWRFTVDYLIREHDLHNLLFVFAPNYLSSREEYLSYYPGDDYVDIWGTDVYCFDDIAYFREVAARALDILRDLARESDKPYALTETGQECVREPQWWTQVLQPLVTDRNLSYVMVWRNAYNRPDHYYAPYPGQGSAEDFVRFVSSPSILMEDNMKTY